MHVWYLTKRLIWLQPSRTPPPPPPPPLPPPPLLAFLLRLSFVSLLVILCSHHPPPFSSSLFRSLAHLFFFIPLRHPSSLFLPHPLTHLVSLSLLHHLFFPISSSFSVSLSIPCYSSLPPSVFCLFFHLSVSSRTELLTLSVRLLFSLDPHILPPSVYFTRVHRAACLASASCTLNQKISI